MKLTTWNAEWLDVDWGVVHGYHEPGQRLFTGKAPTRKKARKRIEAVAGFLASLAPDILFLCEGPRGEAAMTAFVKNVAPDYELIAREGDDAAYEIRGTQWLWFLVRKSLTDRLTPELVPVPTWRAFAAAESSSIGENGKWHVSVPRLETVGGVPDVPVAQRVEHSFYREPQVLKFSFGGASHEIIGAHLKSKYTGAKIRPRKPDETLEQFLRAAKRAREYIAKAHAARSKLTSEASAIRAYIDHRFRQEADPSVLLVGDLNDGPGKELLEREFLLHDLISNLQGNVFLARRFLNHALFDQPDEVRWTASFRDPLEPARNEQILLDHILYTQALARSGSSPLLVRPKAGFVEHLAFESAEAEYGRGLLSDHRPVSVVLSPRGNMDR